MFFIGIEDFLGWREQRQVDVVDAENLLEEELKVVAFRESGELGDVVEADIHDPLGAAIAQESEELRGGLLGEADGVDGGFRIHRSMGHPSRRRRFRVVRRRRLCDTVVIRPVADVAITFVAASTQFLAEEDVANAVFLEFLFQRWSAEPLQTAEWPGPDVGHDLDAVLLEQPEEAGKIVGRVTDGEERVHGSRMAVAILYWNPFGSGGVKLATITRFCGLSSNRRVSPLLTLPGDKPWR